MADDDPLLRDALVQVSFTVMAALSRVAAAHDLSLTQLRLLAILRDREPRMADLADHLGLDRSTITGLIDRAEKRDLVRRLPAAPDKRSTRVTLTPAGHALAATLTTHTTAALAPLTDALSAPDRHRLARLLTRALPPEPSPTP